MYILYCNLEGYICYPFYDFQAAKLNMHMLATLCSILCEVLIFVNTTMI